MNLLVRGKAPRNCWISQRCLPILRTLDELMDHGATNQL